MKVQCDRRAELDGRTCRQVWHENLEGYCDPCAVRWDHDNGKHEDCPEPTCPACKRRRRR